ncbi:hypothetical protein I302_108928 [Kwoniella bestiolae CBS 10118]|uniref:Uncharacterized protein n=1 Tax=Kwoniella bestiolae CBS 10118 TaxID=1296100 RepID=A0A1B9FUH8_9TREE|nr:hypothetical protein I302_08069 [Kwoniella bestiolae CBS 10118]OCF22421.1 hypothetical protein I302_08069 [Kwoniella bestiolae CBS 10118]
MTFFNREVEVWDRPSNPRLEKNVTENTLDSTYSNTRFLGTLDGECSRTADAQPCSSLSSTASVGREVFCHLVVSHGFSPSSLPADLRARLISEDAFKNFRSIGFTLKPVDRSSTYKTLEEHICQGNPQGRFGTLPVSPNMDYTIAADWSYRSPRAIQQFEVSWDIDSPRTEVLSIYDVSSSKDALRDIVSQYPSTVTGGMTIDALVGDIQGFRPWREQVEI